eukprot:c30956_g1_i1.p1 GENE.c30956_g1_i1~~c30956_g1_i1.p1  ORF type:complete len:103 (-),score=55.73 c30956_g1_i1:38-346(-)
MSKEESKEEEKNNSECPWCTFMKAGPCGEEFTAWQDCVRDSREKDRDFVSDCRTISDSLFGCIRENQEYYGENPAGTQEEEEEQQGEQQQQQGSEVTEQKKE